MAVQKTRPTLSDLTPAQVRQRACEYRSMAQGASPAARDALARLAVRFEELATRKEHAASTCADPVAPNTSTQGKVAAQSPAPGESRAASNGSRTNE
jgi:hypothetical protein